MKKKYEWLLILSLMLTSGSILVNRFIIEIPDFLAIIFAVISIVSLIIYILKSKNKISSGKQE